ncbi:hypothetical protein [Paenibacillus gansuensis]|uniref:ABC transporter permease n=1 Tax=Paenibacillus gansuensis TaxID=306542 RepID=A0ABW5PJT7_9BACL
MLNNAWFIAKRDMVIHKWGWLTTFLMGAYFVLILAGILQDYQVREMKVMFPVDLLFCILASVLGFAFTRDYMLYLKEDTFTKKMALYRTLPLRTEEVVLGRILHILVYTLYNSVTIFTVLYFVSRGLNRQLTPLQYVAFVAALIGFSFVFSAFYIFTELGYSGRTYFWLNMIVVVLLIGGIFLLMMLKVSLTDELIVGIRQYGFLIPGMMLLIGIGSLSYAYQATVRHLSTREYR